MRLLLSCKNLSTELMEMSQLFQDLTLEGCRCSEDLMEQGMFTFRFVVDFGFDK